MTQATPGGYAGVPSSEEGKGQAIASLALGILSTTCFCCYPLSIILGIAGTVLGKAAMDSQYRSMATVGMVFSIIGIVLSLLFGTMHVIGMVSASPEDRAETEAMMRQWMGIEGPSETEDDLQLEEGPAEVPDGTFEQPEGGDSFIRPERDQQAR